jgi:recombination protein RecR
MQPLITTLQTALDKITTCSVCCNLDTCSPCSICQDPKRDPTQICVVEDITDLWAVERVHIFQGHYHVLGGVLSAINGTGPQQLNLESLIRRVADPQTQEVVMALNTTLDSQTTTYYVIDCLKPYHKKISRLAYGLPLGGELDYLDDGTLATAFSARHSI